MSKSKSTLASFERYCVRHPHERFWQALRNWSGYGFIYASNIPPGELHTESEAEFINTFSLEGGGKAGWSWQCNQCGSNEFSPAVSEDDLKDDAMSCTNCGGTEFHKVMIW
jgi:DNA-directed RNA polymerase subunit RPC12/RpoP